MPGALQRKLLLLWINGDWEALANYFGLPSWSMGRPCWFCSCAKGECLHVPTSGLSQVRLCSQAFFAWAKAEDRLPCSLFGLPAAGTWLVAVDWMHTVDLGVAQDRKLASQRERERELPSSWHP